MINTKAQLRRCIGGCNLLFASPSAATRVCTDCRKSFTKKQYANRYVDPSDCASDIVSHLDKIEHTLTVEKELRMSTEAIDSAAASKTYDNKSKFRYIPQGPLLTKKQIKIANIIKKVTNKSETKQGSKPANIILGFF